LALAVIAVFSFMASAVAGLFSFMASGFTATTQEQKKNKPMPPPPANRSKQTLLHPRRHAYQPQKRRLLVPTPRTGTCWLGPNRGKGKEAISALAIAETTAADKVASFMTISLLATSMPSSSLSTAWLLVSEASDHMCNDLSLSSWIQRQPAPP